MNNERKSIRLNQVMRKDILENIMQAYVAKTVAPNYLNTAQITEALDKLLITLFYKDYGTDIKNFEDFIEANEIPESAIERTCYFSIRKSNEITRHVNFRDEEGKDLTVPNLHGGSVLYDFFTGEGAVDVNTDKPCVLTPRKPEVEKIHQAVKKLQKAARKDKEKFDQWDLTRKNYAKNIEQVLSGVNTTGQLLEVWAECERFLPVAIVNPSNINLPSVNFTELNKHL